MFGSLRKHFRDRPKLDWFPSPFGQLACIEKAGKFQTGNTFPKQYWRAVNGKPKSKGPKIEP